MRESQEYETTQPGTPKRGLGVNGSGERSSIEAGCPRVFTANTISMDKRKRKMYTSGRPSISQGMNVGMRVANAQETQSLASMTWMAGVGNSVKNCQTNSAFKLGTNTGIDFHKRNILQQANQKNF